MADPRSPPSRDFVDHCIELLTPIGRCQARRMFGGWGLSMDGLTVGIVTDLGSGDKLWLKADEHSRARFEAAGCERFQYTMHQRGQPVLRSMNFYAAPEDAMDAASAMASWARLSLASALATRAAKPLAARKAPAARKAAARKSPER